MRAKPRRLSFAAAGGLLLLAGCVSVKPVVLDRKTQLENQILGTFQRLEEDLILASSVRGEGPQPALSPLEREAVEAMMTREFFRDDIEEYKHQQVVGETRSGFLEILSLPGEVEQAKRVKYLVEEENHSRKVILQRVIGLNRELSDKDLPLLQLIFYRLNVQTARFGDKVQRENGAWMVVQKRDAPPSPDPSAKGR
jgi:uncharacterized protein YdbL (DUF1318 family)